MKKASQIITIISAVLLGLFSLVFIVVESRNLFSGDWLLFENQVNGFFRYFLRFVLSLVSLGISVLPFFLFKKPSTPKRIYFYASAIALFLASLIINEFTTNYVGTALRLIAALYALGAILDFLFIYEEHSKKAKKEETDSNK